MAKKRLVRRCGKCGWPLPKRDRGKYVPVRVEDGTIVQMGSCCAFPPIEEEIDKIREHILEHSMHSLPTEEGIEGHATGLVMAVGKHIRTLVRRAD